MPRPAHPERTVLYVRVSAVMGRDGETFHSPELQTSAMRAVAARHGLKEVAVVEDIDVSGRSFSRDGLDQIRAMVEERQVDVVAVYDLSRLGRNTAEALTFIRWLKDHNVSILSTIEKIDDTPEGQFFLSQFLGMAELYSNQMGRRWSDVIRHRAAKGILHGTPPTGYLRQDGVLVVDPVLGPVIQSLFEQYAQGVGIAELARQLADVKGTRVDFGVLKRMLSNPAYCGLVPRWDRPRVHTSKPVEVFPGIHPRLVSDEVWAACQARREADRVIPPRSLSPSNSLVGLAVCAHCGSGLQRHWDHRRQVARLQCGEQVRVRGDRCGGCGRPRLLRVEAVVVDRLAAYVRMLRDDVVEQAAVLARREAVVGAEDLLVGELAEIRRQMTKLTEGWLAGRVPDGVYDDKIRELKDREEAVSRRRLALAPAPRLVGPAELASAGERLLAMWPSMTDGERNVALRQVVARVVVRRADGYREPEEDRVTVEFL